MSSFVKFVHRLCRAMNAIAGAALAAIVLLTVTDVILRLLRHPIVGTYELVGLMGAVVIGLSLPQSSLDRGQVLMDFLTSRFPEGLRAGLEVVTRLMGVFLFVVVGLNLWALADDLRTAGEVSPTLQLPQYPVAYAISVAAFVQCLVLLTQLVEKRKAIHG